MLTLMNTANKEPNPLVWKKTNICTAPFSFSVYKQSDDIWHVFLEL